MSATTAAATASLDEKTRMNEKTSPREAFMASLEILSTIDWDDVLANQGSSLDSALEIFDTQIEHVLNAFNSIYSRKLSRFLSDAVLALCRPINSVAQFAEFVKAEPRSDIAQRIANNQEKMEELEDRILDAIEDLAKLVIGKSMRTQRFVLSLSPSEENEDNNYHYLNVYLILKVLEKWIGPTDLDLATQYYKESNPGYGSKRSMMRSPQNSGANEDAKAPRKRAMRKFEKIMKLCCTCRVSIEDLISHKPKPLFSTGLNDADDSYDEQALIEDNFPLSDIGIVVLTSGMILLSTTDNFFKTAAAPVVPDSPSALNVKELAEKQQRQKDAILAAISNESIDDDGNPLPAPDSSDATESCPFTVEKDEKDVWDSTATPLHERSPFCQFTFPLTLTPTWVFSYAGGLASTFLSAETGGQGFLADKALVVLLYAIDRLPAGKFEMGQLDFSDPENKLDRMGLFQIYQVLSTFAATNASPAHRFYAFQGLGTLIDGCQEDVQLYLLEQLVSEACPYESMRGAAINLVKSSIEKGFSRLDQDNIRASKATLGPFGPEGLGSQRSVFTTEMVYKTFLKPIWRFEVNAFKPDPLKDLDAWMEKYGTLMHALNFYWYLLNRDQKDENLTSVWDTSNIREMRKEFLEPLKKRVEELKGVFAEKILVVERKQREREGNGDKDVEMKDGAESDVDEEEDSEGEVMKDDEEGQEMVKPLQSQKELEMGQLMHYNQNLLNLEMMEDVFDRLDVLVGGI